MSSISHIFAIIPGQTKQIRCPGTFIKNQRIPRQKQQFLDTFPGNSLGFNEIVVFAQELTPHLKKSTSTYQKKLLYKMGQ
jgi:hypothetical protein